MLREDLRQIFAEEKHQQRAMQVQARMFNIVEDMQGQLGNLRLEPEMQGWTAAGATDKELASTDLATLRTQSLRYYYKNPHGRVVIRNLVKFIIGGGSIIDFREKNEEGLRAITEWWRRATKKLKWFSWQREFITRAFRDGENFVRKIPVDNEPLTLRFIDPDKVVSNDPSITDGIETDPQDVETVVNYHVRMGKEALSTPIPAEQIKHTKIDVDGNVKRGHPILESILTDIAEYRKWRQARMVLNIVRTSVALVKEVQSSPNDLATLRLRQKATRTSTQLENDKTKMLRPGTIISGTPGVAYKMLAPNLDAKDAAEDGETILRSVAAGAGMSDVFITANYGSTNFASSVVSQNTGIREFEDWGHFFIEHLTDIIEWVLQDGVDQGEIPAEVQDEESGKMRPIILDFYMTFPPIIRRDLVQENGAYMSMYEHEQLSGTSWTAKMGFDPDREQRLIADEKAKGIGIDRGTQKKGESPPKRVEDREPRAQLQ